MCSFSIVFDPTAEFVPEQLWAWRRVAGAYASWLPDERGRWVSAALGGIAFTPHGPTLRVYDQEGRLVPLTEELADLLDERERKIAALEAELRRLRGADPA